MKGLSRCGLKARGARETGDEHDGRFGRVTGRLCPDIGTVCGRDIDSRGGRDKRDKSEKRGKLHG